MLKKWTPSQIVDLDVYSPHSESKTKPKHTKEVKLFLYDPFLSMQGPNNNGDQGIINFQ